MQSGQGAGGKFVGVIKSIGTAFGIASDAVGKAFDAISGFFHRNRREISEVEKAFRNLGKAISAVFENVILPVVKRVIPGVTAVVQGGLKVLIGVVRVFTGLLTGNWSQAWKGLKGIVSGALQGVGGTIRAFTAPMREAASRLGQVFSLAFKAALGGIVSFFRGRINELIGVINTAISAYNKIPLAPNIGTIGNIGGGGGGGGVRNTNVPGVLRETHGAIRPGPVSVRPPRGHTATAGTASLSVMAHASGEAGGQELGSLQRAQAWVKANFPGVGTLLEDAGSSNQHLHIETDKGTVVQIGKALQRAGFSVGENPAFGGVHNVHSHGGLAGIPGDHYTGNAIDVNADNRSLGVPTGKGGGSSTSTTQPKWRECVLTWYDPALGGINTGGGKKDPFHPTASGEAYNPRAYTCAAPQSYAFGTIIVFAYGGRAVACKVNDRGGAITGHHFDLSRAAAASLGIMGAGKANGLFMLPGKSKSIKKAKTPFDKLENQLGYIDLETQAGVLTQRQSDNAIIRAVNKALPNLTGSNKLRALGDKRQAQQDLRSLPKPVKQRIGTSIDNPWLQTWIQHQQDLMDAGQLDPIVGRDNIANVLDQFAKGKGVSEHDRLTATAQARDLRFQNLVDLTPAEPQGAVAAEDDRLAHIDLHRRAGDITDTEALTQQKASVEDALALWNLTDDERLQLRAELGDLTKQLGDLTAATQDQTALLQQQIDVEKERSAQLERALAVAQSEERTLGRSLANQLGLTFGIRAGMGKLLPTVGAAQ
jgi:hypothetical protein